jgi:anti-anti-sigma factor
LNPAAVRVDTFWIHEHTEPTGAVVLRLSGELDIATAGQLRDRLHALWADGHAVVLDLGTLEFIDSSGVRELVRAVWRARRDGRSISFATTMGTQVSRIIDLLALRDLFWPPISAHGRPGRAPDPAA